MTGETVAVRGFDDETSGGHSGEAFVERGGANAAGRAQFGERPGLVSPCKGGGDALIDGRRVDAALGLAIGPHRLESQGVVVLDQFKGNARHGGGGPMLNGQDDAIVTVAPEIEVGIAPGMEFRGSAQRLPGADGAGSLLGVVDEHDGDGVTPLQFA